MRHNLILIEGIPGSGKSTLAKRLEQHLQAKGLKAKMYREGDAHPADLAWIACVPIDEYNELLKKYPEQAEKLRQSTQLEDNHALVAYLNLGFLLGENDLMKFLESKEVYNGRSGLQVFRDLHFNRWQKFVDNHDNDIITIFECSFLQNHVNELLLTYCCDYDKVFNYMLQLNQIAAPLDPLLFYLVQPNVKSTIDRVAKERLSPDPGIEAHWIDRVIEYIANSNLGRKNNITNYSGLISYFSSRQQIEQRLVKDLAVESKIITNRDFDWNTVFNQMISYL